MQMKCQLTQHKSVEESGLDIGLDSDSTETETQQTSRASDGGWGLPFGVIIALVPQNVCEQMIYNICHETKLNFAFALTPFNGGGWVTHTHTDKPDRASQPCNNTTLLLWLQFKGGGEEELTSTGCKSTPYMSCHLTLSK